MTKREMLEAVNEKVQAWLWNEYIAEFESKEDVAKHALFVAGVMTIADMIDAHICDPIILDDEEEIDNLFWKEGQLQELYDFFFKYNCTVHDIVENWLFGNDPSAEDLLGLYSWERQLNDVLDNISFLIRDIKRREGQGGK